jgi:hypothetical protein
MNKNHTAGLSIQKLCVKVLRLLYDHIDADPGNDAFKLAIALSALTKVLASLAVMEGLPEHVVYEALKLEMELITESNETRH